MGKFVDMTGWIMSEHGVPDSRIKVICKVGKNNQGAITWLCECLCGNEKQFVATGTYLRNGNTKSCGCLQKEAAVKSGHENKKYNKYDLSGEYGIGWTSNTNEEFYFDLEDYDKIKNICWVVNYSFNTKTLTGANPITGKTISMHRILGFINHDHSDRNELNNRKNNLRPCTSQENARNRTKRCDNKSGVIGVYYDNTSQKWRANITLPNKKSVNLKRHKNKEDAIRERLEAEAKYYGEFAPQRHLFVKYGIAMPEQEVK